MDIILQALADGAKTIANDAATDALKGAYAQLKSLIQERWVGAPSFNEVIAKFGQKPDVCGGELEEKLKEAGISEDETVRQQAKLVIEECNNTKVQNRKDSHGDTATERAMMLKDTEIRTKGDVFNVVGNVSKNVTGKAHDNPVLSHGILLVLAVAVFYFGIESTKAGSLIFWTTPPTSLAQPDLPNNLPEGRTSDQPQPSDKSNSGTQRSSPPAAQAPAAANSTNQQCPTPNNSN
ncbi:MAG: hypothetical protein HC895_05540 [Leptolyngbyaceae cyanobacterium SM1_3_5]|nr:hypothetical protein [Leptolyngbyaceae cyanobacterium SM1_3_5]